MIRFINQIVMSVVQFFSRPVKFALEWLDRIDKTIRQHQTMKGMLMKRGMAISGLYTSLNDMGIGLKSCVAVYLLDLVGTLLQYKRGTVYRQELFWRMGKRPRRIEKASGCEIENVLKRFDSSLE